MPIQPLPKHVVTRIAAGEVIDSLAAVVRELVENSIDAGANRISISLWPEQWRVRVADNGQGMTAGDLERAALPHSTSKFISEIASSTVRQSERQPYDDDSQADVYGSEEYGSEDCGLEDRSSEDYDAEDHRFNNDASGDDASDDGPEPQAEPGSAGLDNIRSLGFRGEALHSLAQLAQLEICSRTLGTSEGWQASYGEGGSLTAMDTVAIAPGTIITVSDLFAAWPARRQALPHPAQQLRQIQRLVQLIALAHPQITWSLSQSDRPWFSLWPGSSAQTLLPQMLRGVAEADLRETSLELSHLGEPASPPGLLQASKKTPPASKLNLLIGLPDRCHRRRPDWVKVAVNGRCIRLPELEQTLLSAMRRALPRDRYPVAFIHIQAEPDQVDWNRHPAKAEIYLRHLSQWQEALKQAVIQALQLAPEAAQITEGARVQDLLKAAEQGAGYSVSRHINPNSKSDATAKAESIRAEGLKALAQVHNTYIVAEHPGGLWLVEQHIAHERVLYEEICDRWHCIPLEPPIVLDQLKKRQLTQLERIGIELEPFGEDLWAARSAPALLADREDCAAALIELSLGGDLQTAQVATACRSAIRNGTVLSLPEMQQLLDQWQQTRQPQTCPHGRPIHMVLAETSLARFFRRHWVIGKSHGI